MGWPGLSRRGAVWGAFCTLGCAAGAHGSPASERACQDVTAGPAPALAAVEQEMHGILLLAAMALVADGWGVDQRRADQVAAYAAIAPGRRFADYLGHNIGALLVDRAGRIICFALNRNVALNSTLEHAEARSVRAAIQIANADHKSSEVPTWSFSNLLLADRLYATLEPCAQCAGILELANVGSVIYAQDDPGQHHILNVLYNLRHQTGGPLPIRAAFDPVWDELAAAYERFVAGAPAGGRTGLTWFLQTPAAYEIYHQASLRFETMQPAWRENVSILRDAQAFRDRWKNRIEQGLAPV
jgi:tRNA(Arg) A34 adenosine deaminase TadA